MLLDANWIKNQLRPAFKDVASVEEKLYSLGVDRNETHVPFMVLFAVIIELIRSRNDECCGLLDRAVPFGTMEMLLRTMSTARSLESAAFTFCQSAEVFDLPYKVILRDEGKDVFVELVVSGKRDIQSMLIEFGYLRFIWASFCWFAGRNIGMSALFTRADFFHHDHRDSAGRRLAPYRSTNDGEPSWGVSDRAGFTIRKSEFKSPPALRKDSHPLIEAFKWCGTLNLEGQESSRTAKAKLQNAEIPAPFYDVVNESPFGPTGGNLRSAKHIQIVRAKVLLSASAKTTAQIAYDLGFKTERNFRDSFQRATGHTPSHYRDLYDGETLMGSDHLFDQILNALRDERSGEPVDLKWFSPSHS